MKIAFYMDDGLEQLVFTPETESEKKILSKLHDGGRELSIKRGAFFECKGGWMRYSPYGNDYGDESTMIVLRPKADEPEEIIPKEEVMA